MDIGRFPIAVCLVLCAVVAVAFSRSIPSQEGKTTTYLRKVIPDILFSCPVQIGQCSKFGLLFSFFPFQRFCRLLFNHKAVDV